MFPISHDGFKFLVSEKKKNQQKKKKIQWKENADTRGDPDCLPHVRNCLLKGPAPPARLTPAARPRGAVPAVAARSRGRAPALTVRAGAGGAAPPRCHRPPRTPPPFVLIKVFSPFFPPAAPSPPTPFRKALTAQGGRLGRCSLPPPPSLPRSHPHSSNAARTVGQRPPPRPPPHGPGRTTPGGGCGGERLATRGRPPAAPRPRRPARPPSSPPSPLENGAETEKTSPISL